MLKQTLTRTVCIMALLGGCVQDDGISQVERQPEIYRTQAAMRFQGPPAITGISDEFVSVELTLKNTSDVAVCLDSASGRQMLQHDSQSITWGVRDIVFEPSSSRLAPNDEVTFLITVELFDMYAFGDGSVQNYGYTPRYRDVLNDDLDESEKRYPIEIFDNIYGKNIQLFFSFALAICDPKSTFFVVESPSTAKFRLTPPL
jgi:hypothetical protein